MKLIQNFGRLLALMGIFALAACGAQTTTLANGDIAELATLEGFSTAAGVLSTYATDPATGQLVLTARDAHLGTGALGQIAVAASGGAIAAAINGATARDVAEASACPDAPAGTQVYVGCGATYIPVQAVADADAVIDNDIGIDVGCTTCSMLD